LVQNEELQMDDPSTSGVTAVLKELRAYRF